MKKLRLISYYCFIIIILFITLSFSQEKSNQTDNVTKLEKEYNFLKEQTLNYQAFVERERAEHRKFLEDLYTKIVWYVGVLTTVAFGFFVFFGFKNKRDITAMVDQLFKEHGIRIIDQRNDEIKISIRDLQRLLDKETNYYKKSILFLMPEADKENFESNELTVIDLRGLKNHQLITNMNEAIPLIKNETFNVLVYYYNPVSEELGDKNLREILKTLSLRKSKLPVIIYSYGKGFEGRLYKIDMKEVANYPYAVSANFPITLVNTLHTVANYFPVS